MIKILRVDDTFLYGRKSLLWGNITNAKTIFLIDDGLRCDYFAQTMLTLSGSVKVKLIFLSLKEGQEQFAKHQGSRESCIVVIGSFSQLLAMHPYLEGISRVNVGSVRGNSAEELMALKRLREEHIDFEIRDFPDDKPIIL